jgi:hypothetical protein
MEAADTGGPILSTAAQQLLADEMTKAIVIFNAFHIGPREPKIMELIHECSASIKSGVVDDAQLQDPVRVILPDNKELTMPAELFISLLASTKHLADMAAKYGRLGKAARAGRTK